ncbi:MAG: hypothetical protein KA204_06830 [Chromatiaceae bacterium]|nr:hypothetical protein [Chromatiaceae bacterium]
MQTDPLIDIGQAALNALGMGDRTDVAEIRIAILPQQFPQVTIVTELTNPDGIEPFFSYIADHFDLVPNASPIGIGTPETDQPE